MLSAVLLHPTIVTKTPTTVSSLNHSVAVGSCTRISDRQYFLLKKAHSYRRSFFSEFSQVLEIVGNMYQDTEAFCHYS